MLGPERLQCSLCTTLMSRRMSQLHVAWAPNIMNNTQQSKLIAEIHEAWAVAHGYRTKVQAPSCKPEDLHAENTNQFVKAASRQAPSAKRQAPSINNFCISVQLTAGHDPWPTDHSSWISDPGTSFRDLGPRALTRINVFFG